MKHVYGEEAPVLKNLQKMKAEKEELPVEERTRIKEEMRAMIRKMKERMGDRLTINPMGQRAVLKAIGDHPECEGARSQEPPQNLDS